MHNREKNLSYIQLASDELDLTPEEEVAYYKALGIRTKQQLLTEIMKSKAKFLDPDRHSKQKSAAFYIRLEGLIDKFYGEVSEMFLMEELDNWWGYGFAIRETGIKLKLEHLLVMYDDNIWYENPKAEKHFLISDEDFTIHETKAKLLSLEEYGNIYNVAADTVRQWIRRGKIRSAVKLGSEWRIPEISDKPERGYTPGHYMWETELPDPPEEIPDINDFDNLSIQTAPEPGMWFAMLNCYEKKGENAGRAMTGKMKEKLEIYLIAHPLVECMNNALGEVHQIEEDIPNEQERNGDSDVKES